MKNSILSFLLLVSTLGFSQTAKVTIKQEGFGEQHNLKVSISGNYVEVNPSGELIFSSDIDLTKPVYGMVISKSGMYSGFYVEQGATEVIVKKKGFPSSLEVAGSKSHAIYSSISHAKSDTDFLQNALANIESPIALNIFNQKFKFTKLKPEELRKVYDLATPENQRKYLDDLNAFLQTYDMEKAEVGGQIIDFEAQDQYGKSYSTEQFRGKYLLLDFAATSCAPCWTGYPDMLKQTSKYKNLQVITYNEDGAIDKWNNIAKNRKIDLPWPVLWKGENKLEVFDLYQVEGWPFHYLISPEGEILDSWLGSGGNTLETKLSKHIKED